MNKLFLLLALTVCIAEIQAQESIVTTGGEASTAGGSVCYTLGQVVYRAITGATGSATEGVQQPYELSVVSEIEELGIGLQISLYPNPSYDNIILEITDVESLKSRCTMILFDVDGRVLKSKPVQSNKTTIDMTGLEPQIYFLRINMDQKTTTFKIVKKEKL